MTPAQHLPAIHAETHGQPFPGETRGLLYHGQPLHWRPLLIGGHHDDRDEAIAVLADYFSGVMTQEESIEIIQLYFAG